MASKEASVATAILIVGTASGVFAEFCPSWFTTASPFFHEQEAKDGNVKRIRQGEIAAGAIVVAMGWAASRVTGDPLPLLASALITAVSIAGYEYQIAHPASEDEASDGGHFGWFHP